MRRYERLFIALIIAVLAAMSATAGANSARLSATWSNKPISDVLGVLQRQFGVNYVLPAELASRQVTVTVHDATPNRALQAAVASAGLQAELQSGTWVITAAPSTRGDRAYAQYAGPGAPDAGGGFSLPGPSGAFGAAPSRPQRPGSAAQTGPMGTAAPQRSGPGGLPGGLGTTAATGTAATRPLHYIVIPLFRASPETIGYTLSADDIIYDLSGGGGYGGYGSSGYGGSYGSGYGSSRGSSSRGSSRGSSSRGSSRGSSRSYY